MEDTNIIRRPWNIA